MSVIEALRNRYPLPEYVLLEEVANGTGSHGTRRADAIAMSLWPSRGLHLTGFEIKTARNDWIRELKNPAKAESIAQYCDFWYIATCGNVVKAGEIPPGWGHMEWNGKRWFVLQPAPKLNPVPMDRLFLAALMRRAGEFNSSQVAQSVRAEIERLREDSAKQLASATKANNREYGELVEKLKKIKAETGIDLLDWNPAPAVIDALRFATTTNIASSHGRLRNLQRHLKASLDMLEEAIPQENTHG